MTKSRLQVLLYNTLVYLNSKFFNALSSDEKLDILKTEFGFTEEELAALEIDSVLIK